MYTHILIPTDGSPLASEGVRQGIQLAKAVGGRVTAVAVSEPLLGILLLGEPEPTVTMENAEIRRAAMRAANRVLEAVCAEATTAGVTRDRVHVQDRLPADGILDTATERGCDLIVMASHGRRGIQRALLGSQANEVLTRSKVPVMIVRATAS